MDSTLLQDLVEDDFGYKHEGRNWGRSLEHSSLVVNEESQRWYWNSENTGGNIEDYLVYVRGHNKKSAKEIINLRGRISRGTVPNPTEDREVMPYEKLIEVFWELGKGNRDYWYDRMLSDKTIDRYRLGFYDGWSLIPLYDVYGRFENFQCRRDKPSRAMKYWYRNVSKPILFNLEILQLLDYVFITEGMVDSILLNQVGMPAISQTGGAGYWNNEWFSLFNRIKTVYYIADNDKAGRFAAQRVALHLGTERVKIYMFEDKPEKYDSVDYFRDGGGVEEFRDDVMGKSKYLYEIGELNGGNRVSKNRLRKALRAHG